MSRCGGGRLLVLFSSNRMSNILQPRLLTSDNPFTVLKFHKRTKKTSYDAPHRALARRPIRVYVPGEKIPEPGIQMKSKPTIEQEWSKIGTTEKPSGDIFGKIMGDIVNNVNRKKIAVEGTRVIEEALKAGLRPEKLFLLKSLKDIPPAIKTWMDDGSVELIKVTQKQMETWSSVTTPPGLIGIFPKPNPDDVLKIRATSSEFQQIPLTIICDNLREPGNLGSILRSAVGVGCKAILLSTGCTDPWDLKVLRGGSGAHFQIPIHTGIHMSNIGSFIEFHGNDPDPSSPQDQKSFKETGVFLADSNRENAKSKLPLLSYTEVNYRRFHKIYLVIGGETEGLSRTTLEITNSLNEEKVGPSGMKKTVARLHIPLQSQVESLNVANAFGIIAFEIRRQFQSSSVDSSLKSF